MQGHSPSVQLKEPYIGYLNGYVQAHSYNDKKIFV